MSTPMDPNDRNDRNDRNGPPANRSIKIIERAAPPAPPRSTPVPQGPSLTEIYSMAAESLVTSLETAKALSERVFGKEVGPSVVLEVHTKLQEEIDGLLEHYETDEDEEDEEEDEDE